MGTTWTTYAAGWKKVGFQPSFSRHAKADASIALVIWLNEKVVIVVKVVSLKNIQLSLKSESSKRDSNFRNLKELIIEN